MSFPAWNGGKDKGAFRTLSDVAGGTDGIRTVTQTQGDTTTTLRTRAGNPEMTIRKKPGRRLDLTEPVYKLRKYFVHEDFKDVKDSTRSEYTLSAIALFIKKIVTLAGAIVFKEPPVESEVFYTTPGDYDAWPADRKARFYKPQIAWSSDGIFSFVRHAPKTAMLEGSVIKFGDMLHKAGNVTPVELDTADEGYLVRKFHPPMLMRVSRFDRSSQLFLVNPVKSADVLVGGASGKIKFAKPKEIQLEKDNDTSVFEMTGGREGEVFGVHTERTCYFDHYRVWGMPWHGKLDKNGEFVTENNVTYSSEYPVRGYQCQLVKFADTATPAYTSHDLEFDANIETKGLAWKNYAILSGNRRRYDPFCGRVFTPESGEPTLPEPTHGPGSNGAEVFEFGPNTWLYKTAKGVVWCLQVYRSLVHHAVNDARVVAWKMNETFSEPLDHVPTRFTVCSGIDDTHLSIGNNFLNNRTWLSAAGDGTKAVYCNTRTSLWYLIGGENASGLQVVSTQFNSGVQAYPDLPWPTPAWRVFEGVAENGAPYVVFTVSDPADGAVDSPPTVTFEQFDGNEDRLTEDCSFPEVFTAGTHTQNFHYKLLVSVTVNPLTGAVLKTFADFSGTITANHWMTTHPAIVDSFFPLPERYTYKAMCTAAQGQKKIIVNGVVVYDYNSTGTASTPDDLLSDYTYAYNHLSMAAQRYSDGSVMQFVLQHSEGTGAVVTSSDTTSWARGSLGQTLNIPVPTGAWTCNASQHPVTGELAYEKVFF